MKALITGGTGLLGTGLLAKLHDAVIVSRTAVKATGPSRAIQWAPEAEPAPLDALHGVEAVFNLAGEPVADARWSAEKKRRIRDSRVVGTRNLVEGLKLLGRKPEVLVSASAVGYYGDRGDEKLDEASTGGRDFLAQVCAEWEHEALAAQTLGIRVVCVRIGLVLAPGGGALARMLTPFKLGVGGRLGSGQQWMPWVHVDDVIGLLLHASQSETIRGAMNAVSPHPVTNADFTRALGHAVHRPALLPVPKTALRLAFGEMSEILTTSSRVLPSVAEHTGYAFKYPELNGALAAVMQVSHPTTA